MSELTAVEYLKLKLKKLEKEINEMENKDQNSLSGFLNIYENDQFRTKEEANQSAKENRIACIDLSQFNKGDGL